MLIFISHSDLSSEAPGGILLSEYLEKRLETVFGCQCVVLDCWCDGVLCAPDGNPLDIRTVYQKADNSGKQRHYYIEDLREMLYDHTEQKCDNGHHRLCYGHPVFKSLLAFLLGMLTALLIKRL